MAKVVNVVVFALGEDVKIESGDFHSSFYADGKGYSYQEKSLTDGILVAKVLVDDVVEGKTWRLSLSGFRLSDGATGYRTEIFFNQSFALWTRISGKPSSTSATIQGLSYAPVRDEEIKSVKDNRGDGFPLDLTLSVILGSVDKALASRKVLLSDGSYTRLRKEAGLSPTEAYKVLAVANLVLSEEEYALITAQRLKRKLGALRKSEMPAFFDGLNDETKIALVEMMNQNSELIPHNTLLEIEKDLRTVLANR
jgi:hypothetical protein